MERKRPKSPPLIGAVTALVVSSLLVTNHRLRNPFHPRQTLYTKEMAQSQEARLQQYERDLAKSNDLLYARDIQIQQLVEDLEQKKAENKILYTILASNRSEDDPLDDNYFTTAIGQLQADILAIVKRHFQHPKRTRWSAFEAIRAADDRDFFLQSHIATSIECVFFIHEARVFSLDAKLEADQANFEAQLEAAQGKPDPMGPFTCFF